MKAYILCTERISGDTSPMKKGITLSEREMQKWINKKFKTVFPSALEVRLFAKSMDVELED